MVRCFAKVSAGTILGGLLAVVMWAQATPLQQDATTPYARWKYKPAATVNDFPIAVWLQSPAQAAKYKAAGFNQYVALWEGPTEAQLAELKAANMPVICAQNAVGLAHKNDPLIVGWMHGDEPDNAQSVKDPVTGKEAYGPCIPPERIVADYNKLRAADPGRPILLNLGQGVANDEWVGRGSGAKLDDYATYVKGGDIVSFDVYPVAGLDKPKSEDYLWYVPKGVDRLNQWAGPQRAVWNCIECTGIDSTRKAAPHQVRAEVWMALIHGSKGLIYFVHQFKPKFNEHALLDDPAMLSAVTDINKQIHTLAPVLNSRTIPRAAEVRSSSAQVPIDIMVKQKGQTLFLFAVGMRNGATQGAFTVQDLPGTRTAEVLGESRTITIQNGRFTDTFESYAVHLYRIRKYHLGVPSSAP